MSDVALIAILVVVFALAIGLVRVLGRLIDSDAPDDWADEPQDSATPSGPSRRPQDGTL